MARRKHKNPKARSSAAKRMLSMAMKKKAMMKGAVSGNGDADKVAPQTNMSEPAMPGQP